MDRDERDPIFIADASSKTLCFDTCDRFADGCRDCDRLKQYGQGSNPGVSQR